MINKKNILLTFVLVTFVMNAKVVISSTIEASNLFINKVFMSIFPFIILSDILIYFKYHVFLGKIFGRFLGRVFNISNESASIIILSMLSSHPSNALFIKNSLDNNYIDFYEGERVFNYTFFPSIMFVVGMIGINLFGDIKIGLILLLLNYLCNFSIGLFLRKNNYVSYHVSYYDKDDYKSFFIVLKESILKAINTSFLILGNITIFLIIINIINHYIYMPDIIKGIFSGLFEMTSGIVYISSLDICMNVKLFLVSFLLNFSGLAIFFQGASIISPYKLSYKKILVLKLIFSLICSSVLLFFN